MKFIALILTLVSINVFNAFAGQKPENLAPENSVFYTQEAPQYTENPAYTIKHTGFIETILSGHTSKATDSTNFHSTRIGRLNAGSVFEVSDFDANFKGVLDVSFGSNSYDDTSSLATINQGYVELRNANSQPIQAKVRVGLQQSAATILAVNATTPMKYNQGVNANWVRFISPPTLSSTGYNPIFFLQSTTLTSQGFAATQFLSDENYAQPSPYWSYANAGINLTTDRYSGFKLGFSYQPTTNNFANPTKDFRGNSFTNQQQMFMKNIKSVAVNYLDEWNGVSLNTTISGEFADIEKSSTATFERNNLAQYSIGTNVSFAGLTLAGSYANTGESLEIQNDANRTTIGDSYTADAGISYAFGSHQFSISHIKTSFMNNKMDATILILNEDLSHAGRIKLTTLYELGFYKFSPASYQSSGTTTAINSLSGMFLSVGLRTSF